MPSDTRETCSTLVRSGPSALLLDAGSGVARLGQRPELLAGVEELTVLLTHFHHDHIAGLSFMSLLELDRPPALLGPGEALYGASTRSILARLLSPPFYTAALDALLEPIGELSPRTTQAGGFEVAVRRQDKHGVPTLGLRIGDEVALCTDTAYDSANVAFAAGVRLLLHEAWRTEAESRNKDSHSSAREAATVASAAGVGELVLVHVHPLQEVRELEAEARSEFEHSVAGSDLLTRELR